MKLYVVGLGSSCCGSGYSRTGGYGKTNKVWKKNRYNEVGIRMFRRIV